ncbi:hypothetical protein B9N43_08080 [Denitratisoma sp. DHT3]|uniref:CoA transferase n=1 Tax=Denitratisoma sp. DHT3 TaxID=1981880 RepID=UPI0011989542|nr:CoA transferase [Denitratisoma sp. DHT3]QDX81199.1 hypothetical protein B9N43_08080 [Denitratisoma sp. DHT3]
MPNPNPHYGSGVFRRRLRLDAGSDQVRVELEDCNHAFRLTLRHDGERVTAVEPEAVRHPFTTCPEALAVIGRVVGHRLTDGAQSLRQRLVPGDNCTHLFDMTVLALAHVDDAGLTRLYEIAVDDERDGVTAARIDCDGRTVHEWRVRAHVIEQPEALAGRPFMRGFFAWASQTFAGMALEAATALQRGYFVAQARRSVSLPVEQHPATADGMPDGVCYSYNSGIVQRALRITGSVRDYSAGPEGLLDFTPVTQNNSVSRGKPGGAMTDKTGRPGALAGIKVVDFGQMVSAPYCAKLFSDYGADVIKVEPPGGDMARRMGPFPGDVPHPEKSGLYFFHNTNKRGITCDVASEEGRTLFLRLLQWADVLIENHLPRQMKEWGLDYERLVTINPKLVVISITPFGQTGPYAGWNGYDLNAYHLTGASSRYCGRPGGMPLEHGTFSADYFGAISAATWGMAAVYGRELVGGGQQVDVSCAEAIAATFVGGQNIGGLAQDGIFDKRTGVGMPQGAPATIMPCKDGHVWMLALEPGQWNGLRKVMGDPEWADLDIFQNMKTRAENADVIYSFLQEWTMEHTKMEIQEKCQAAGCPITAVYTVAEAAEEPHLKARDYFVDMEHPELGKLKNLGAPFKLPACPGGPERPAPLLGQHNDEVYGGVLGLGADEIRGLRARAVI